MPSRFFERCTKYWQLFSSQAWTSLMSQESSSSSRPTRDSGASTGRLRARMASSRSLRRARPSSMAFNWGRKGRACWSGWRTRWTASVSASLRRTMYALWAGRATSQSYISSERRMLIYLQLDCRGYSPASSQYPPIIMLHKYELLVENIDVFVLGDRCARLLALLFPDEPIPHLLSRPDSDALRFLEHTSQRLGRKLDLFRDKVYIDGRDLGFFRELDLSLTCESVWFNFTFKELTEQALDEFGSHFACTGSSILLVCLSAERYEEYSWLADHFQRKEGGFKFSSIPRHVGESAEQFLQSQLVVGQGLEFEHVLLLKIDEEGRVLAGGQKVNPINWILKRHFLKKYNVEPASWLVEELMRHQERKAGRGCGLF